MAGALAMVPRWAAGWFRLGELREAAGNPADAAPAFAEALRLDPADRLGAGARLALLAPSQATAALSSAFVEALFDTYSDDFDNSLVRRLTYRGPEDIAALLPDRRFADALDLGCGTGLMGVALRARCDRLEGWDISAGMLRRAAAKGVYDRLERVDLTRLPPPRATRDLVVAADVFIYIGPLDAIAAWVARTLLPGGLFAFSVERHDGEGAALAAERRFRHGYGYVEAVLRDAGFQDIVSREVVLRYDRDVPVMCWLFVATAPAAA
jgi:predicted TPR repeat methyltransferase